MTVSVVMALYNAADDLPACLDALAEVAPGVPLVVQDGGSTDATLEILKQHPASKDAKIESEPDRGIYDALTKAIARVETDYLYILGADDRVLPGWQEVAMSLAPTSSLVYGDVEMVSDGRRHAGMFDNRKLARTNICQQAIFYPTKLFNHVSFDQRFRYQADWALHMACWADPEWQFQYVPHVVCRYNDRDGASSSVYDDGFVRAYPRLLWRYLPRWTFFRYGLLAWLAHYTRGIRGKNR